MIWYRHCTQMNLEGWGVRLLYFRSMTEQSAREFTCAGTDNLAAYFDPRLSGTCMYVRIRLSL